jgi:Fe-S-cluster containining protein
VLKTAVEHYKMNDLGLDKPHFLGKHLVPGVWRHFFPEDFLHFKFPEERFANCAKCPMVVSDGFNPVYKCCTHIPRVPNFLLGLALLDPNSAALIENMIANGFATPEGTVVTPGQARAALAQNAAGNFGKKLDARCDFLDVKTGRCGIYLYRNSVCSTFFCKSDLDSAGVEFWERVQGMAGQVETALSQWAMEEAGVDVVPYFKRFDQLSQGMIEGKTDSWNWSEHDRSILWGEWYGKEKEFYIKCAEMIRENRNELYEIACNVPILEPELYESRFRDSLTPELRKELDEEMSKGSPVPVENLWYKLNLSHRNLWRLPEPGEKFILNAELTISENTGETEIDAHHHQYPYILVLRGSAERKFYASSDEHEFLMQFKTPKAVTHNFLAAFKKIEAMEYFVEIEAKQIVTTLHS